MFWLEPFEAGRLEDIEVAPLTGRTLSRVGYYGGRGDFLLLFYYDVYTHYEHTIDRFGRHVPLHLPRNDGTDRNGSVNISNQ